MNTHAYVYPLIFALAIMHVPVILAWFQDVLCTDILLTGEISLKCTLLEIFTYKTST